MREVVIAGAARTPIGAFGGTLKDVPARQLGAICIREALQRAGVDPATVDEVVMGNVLQAGLGQNVARQMARDAGVPKEVPAFTLNKVCGSGLRAVSLAAQMDQSRGGGDHRSRRRREHVSGRLCSSVCKVGIPHGGCSHDGRYAQGRSHRCFLRYPHGDHGRKHLRAVGTDQRRTG